MTITKLKHLFVTVVAFGSLAISHAFAEVADAIYYNGAILTMAGSEPTYVEALAVKNGKIALAGSKDDALGMKGDGTRVVDLQGKALLPGSLAAEARISTMPDPTLTAAWGAPAIVWRCGVAAPQSYNRTSQLVTVDGVEWYPEQLSAGTRFTAVAAEPMTELTVPARYANAAGVLAELQSAIAGPDGAAAPQ